MTKIDVINIIDLLLATMLVFHIVESTISSRRRLNRMARLSKLNGKKQMGIFRILCNRLYGAEEISIGKIGGIMIMALSFLMLSLHGSLFGLIGLIISCTLGGVKVYYSIKSRLQVTS